MALRANSWVCCRQLPYHPCKNGTHSTCFCSTREEHTGSWRTGKLFFARTSPPEIRPERFMFIEQDHKGIWGQKLNTNFLFQTFRAPPISQLKQKTGDIPPKRFGFPGFEGHTDFLARPPTHWKISGPKSLSLCSFFLPEFMLFFTSELSRAPVVQSLEGRA